MKQDIAPYEHDYRTNTRLGHRGRGQHREFAGSSGIPDSPVRVHGCAHPRRIGQVPSPTGQLGPVSPWNGGKNVTRATSRPDACRRSDRDCRWDRSRPQTADLRLHRCRLVGIDHNKPVADSRIL